MSGKGLIWEWRQWRDGVHVERSVTLPPNESMIVATVSEVDVRLREYASARSRQLQLGRLDVCSLALVTLWGDIQHHAHEMSLRYAAECLDDDVPIDWIAEAAGTHIGDEIRQQWTEDIERYKNRRDGLDD